MGIGMDTYPAEIRLERRLHLAAYTLVQCLTTAAGAMDLLFYTRLDLGPASGLPGHMEQALDMAITVALL